MFTRSPCNGLSAILGFRGDARWVPVGVLLTMLPALVLAESPRRADDQKAPRPIAFATPLAGAVEAAGATDAADGSPESVLWDQSNYAPSSPNLIDQEFGDVPTYSTYQVHDFTVSPPGWNVAAVSTYFTVSFGAWSPGIVQARLNLYPKTGALPLPTEDPSGGLVVQVSLTNLGDAWRATADTTSVAALQNLAPGDYWIGLTPIADYAAFGQEFHYRSATPVGSPSAVRNPAGAFGLGTQWSDYGLFGQTPGDGAFLLEGTVVVPHITATLQGTTLVVTGSSGDDQVVLRLASGDPNTIEVDDLSTGPGADFTFAVSSFDNISVSTLEGDDLILVDDGNGAVLVGKSATLDAGADVNTVIGGTGSHTYEEVLDLLAILETARSLEGQAAALRDRYLNEFVPAAAERARQFHDVLVPQAQALVDSASALSAQAESDLVAPAANLLAQQEALAALWEAFVASDLVALENAVDAFARDAAETLELNEWTHLAGTFGQIERLLSQMDAAIRDPNAVEALAAQTTALVEDYDARAAGVEALAAAELSARADALLAQVEALFVAPAEDLRAQAEALEAASDALEAQVEGDLTSQAAALEAALDAYHAQVEADLAGRAAEYEADAAALVSAATSIIAQAASLWGAGDGGGDSVVPPCGLVPGTGWVITINPGGPILLGAPTSNNVLIGGAASQLIIGGSLNDIVYAGGGNDLVIDLQGTNELNGEDGIDLIFGGSGKDCITGGNDYDLLVGDVPIFGPGVGDLMHGNNDIDIMLGMGGGDEMYGDDDIDLMFGDDPFFGFSGPDDMYGGDGRLITVTGVFSFECGNLMLGMADQDKLYGGVKNDFMFGGGDNDEMHGDDGCDWMFGNVGADKMFGEDGGTAITIWISGNPTPIRFGNFMFGNDDADEMHGGINSDLVVGNDAGDLMYGDASASGDILPFDTLLGGSGADTMFGDDDKDLMFGQTDADVMHGNNDIDVIWGGPAGDTLFGEDGADFIVGEGGSDTISGGPGPLDMLFGGAAADTLFGNAGVDMIFGNADNDLVNGHDAFDFICGNRDNDNLNGGDGPDFILGGRGNDLIHGDDGLDFLFGGRDQDVVHGDAAADFAFGGDADDLVYGEDGLDFLFGNDGADTLYGGLKTDLIAGNDGCDLLYGDDQLDILMGGADDDEIHGGWGRDTAFGQGGDDRIYGEGDGDLLLVGNDDDDKLYGGPGVDIMLGGDGDDQLQGDDGGDWMWGESGHDELVGGNSADKIFGGPGNDCLAGDAGMDILRGAEGDDHIEGGADGDQILCADDNDIAFGQGGNDWIYGGVGNGNDDLDGGDDKDRMFGQDGDDRLLGQNGNDRLFGNSGDDKLDGGPGNDVISGGPGSDDAWGNGGTNWISSATSHSGSSGMSFLGAPCSEICGTKWDDLNANGIWDAGEPCMPGVTIYLDLNGNNQLDSGEPWTVTMWDDPTTVCVNECGTYCFTGLRPGTYTVREIVPSGYNQTFPTGPDEHVVGLGPRQTVSGKDFGNSNCNPQQGVDFTGPFAPANWTFTPGQGGTGNLVTSHMFVGDMHSGTPSQAYYAITVPNGCTVTFDWFHTTFGGGGPNDYIFYKINGVTTVLSYSPGGFGSATVTIPPGATFSLGVSTEFGDGNLEVLNFRYLCGC